MPNDRDGKVSRLFLDWTGRQKKTAKTRPGSRRQFMIDPVLLRLAMVVVLAIITVFLAFPMPDSLLMGEIADRDVKADRDLMVEDPVATQEKRINARQDALPVFDLNDTAAQSIREAVGQIFSLGRQLYAKDSEPKTVSANPGEAPSPKQLEEFKDTFNSTFRLDPKDGYFETFAQMGFSTQAERAILQLVIELLNQGIVEDRKVLTEQGENGIIVRRAYSKQEDVMPFATTFPGLMEARRLIRERTLLLSTDFSSRQTKAIVAAAQSLLRPNLVLNAEETAKRRDQAEKAVAPVFFQVKRGEMIVREGERIDKQTRLKLQAQARMADRGDWFPKAIGLFLLTTLFIIVTYITCARVHKSLHISLKDLAFMSTLLVIGLLMAFSAAQVGDAMGRGWPGVSKSTVVYLTPAAASAMLATIFLGPAQGVLFAVISSALTGMVFDRSMAMFFYCFMGSLAGIAGLIEVRRRGAVIKAGLLVSLANVGTILAFGFMHQVPVSTNSAFYLVAGILSGSLSGVIVSGFTPLFEMVFRYTTNIKLMELTNLDQPVLRELMVQAPGSYHHSVIVGAMVEAAAEAIGANPLLSKVAAYYHDLGKMKKPLYFVENQVAGENKHEKLAPSMSALILTSHVKDGVELARQNKLSPEIVQIIQQHHGTSLIAFFYQKAKENRTEDQPDINIEDFRYPGPKPQTREAGLVMLADAVEAASRTVSDPTPARIQGMVQKIINNIFSDGQLDECELTLKDLHLIARSFNKILTGIFHRRIAYPEPASKDGSSKAKASNGNNPKQPAKESNGRSGPGDGKGKEDLKRLGIS